MTSPDILSNTPKRGAGVRRLNRAPLFFAFVIVCLLLGAVTYTYQMRLADQRRKAAEQESKPQPANHHALFKTDPDNGLIPALVKEEPKPDEPTAEAQPSPDPAWEEHYQRLARRRQAREQAMTQALGASTSVGHGLTQTAQKPTEDPAAGLSSPYNAADRRARRLLAGLHDEQDHDLNQAAAKRQFLIDGAAPRSREAHYLPAGREAPLSPYEVKAGTIIPSVMIGGANSDLPGQLLAQVSENIYDTATGRYVLIPQGAKLVGTYDNSVTTGQERVLVAWTRIIYPDASSIDLGKMPGADQAGHAGFHDQVNDHFWKVFGNAVMLSLFSGGLQLSQGQGNSVTSNGMNAPQTLAAAIGQQMGQVGMEMARRNMQIQPTLEIRPGYRFIVQVTSDMVIRPWISRRS